METFLNDFFGFFRINSMINSCEFYNSCVFVLILEKLWWKTDLFLYLNHITVLQTLLVVTQRKRNSPVNWNDLINRLTKSFLGFFSKMREEILSG